MQERLSRRIDERYVSIAELNGTQLAYFDSGPSGPTFLMSHGFAMDHTMFSTQVASLAPEFRVVTWDQRGWGSSNARGPHTLWDSARDVLALLDYLGIETAALGGMSQGGFVALRVALLAPGRVRALVLMDTQSGLEDRKGPDRLIATWKSRGSNSIQDGLASTLLGPGEWTDWFQKWERIDYQQLDWAYQCLIERDDVTDRLSQIRCPSLVIHGTLDEAVEFKKGLELRDRLGGPTTFIPIEGGRHASNITHSEMVNDAIRTFLRDLGN
jgi:3-oxoadipate enol-lactonase